jgi:peptide/nickel transport system permease protein
VAVHGVKSEGSNATTLSDSPAGRMRRLSLRLTESPTLGVIMRLLSSRKGAVGTACLVVFIGGAVIGPPLAPYDPNELHLRAQLAAPSALYLFGTDELGRDILSRVVYGIPVALVAGFLAVLLAAIVGSVTGLIAGYSSGWSDAAIMRVWDTLLAFPAIFLAIAIVTIAGPGYKNAIIAVAVINTPTFARLVRATTLSLKQADFVEAARSLGASSSRIMFKTILPNCISPIMVQMAVAVPAAILVEASLSYLGLGSQPPQASWGNMLTSAQGYLYRSPTYGVFPGLAITVVVIGMNYFADGLQDAIDPRRLRGGNRLK